MAKNYSATNRERGLLAGFWLACFCIVLLIVAVLFLKHEIRSEYFEKTLEQVSVLYVPYLGAIVAFYFAANTPQKPQSRRTQGPIRLAVITSLIWNTVVIGCFLLVTFGLLGIENALEYAPRIGGALSWLVAPAIGYFFAKSADTRE